MRPAELRAMYARQMDENGSTVELRRGDATAMARARVKGRSAEELASGVDQRSREVIVLAEDLEAEGFPVPPRKGDALWIGDRKTTVEYVDEDTRRIGDTVIAYVIEVLGS